MLTTLETTETEPVETAAGVDAELAYLIQHGLTPEQVAERLKKTIHAINWAIAENKLACRLIFRRRLIRPADADAWGLACKIGRPRGEVPQVRPVQKRGRKPGYSPMKKILLAQEAELQTKWPDEYADLVPESQGRKLLKVTNQGNSVMSEGQKVFTFERDLEVWAQRGKLTVYSGGTRREIPLKDV